MPIEVENFIIRPQRFEGENNLADKVERMNDRQYVRGQQKQRHKDNLMDDLLKYTDPKEFFTGTPQDPVITQNLKSILDEGAKMITDNEGLDNAMLYTALAPKIGKLSAASQNLRQIEQQRKQSEELLKPHKGIDLEQYNRAFKQNAFLNPDGTPKDLSTVDPNQDYVDLTLKNSDVYNNTGFDQFSKEAGMWTDTGKVKQTDKRGGSKMFKTKLSAPTYLTSEKDSEGHHVDFVPKYEIATEGGKPLMHDFKNADGTITKAPVRLLDKTIMNDLPPDAKAYILQETRRYAKEHNIPLGSIQAENFARAFAYDELNAPTKKRGSVEYIEETKAPQIKVYNNNSKSDDEANLNDIYERIKKKGLQRAADYTKGDYVDNALEGSDLSGDELEVVMKATQNKDLLPNDVKVIVEENGRIGVYEKGSGKRLVYLNQTGVNLPKQAGKAGKEASVEKGNETFAPQKGKNIIQRAVDKLTGKGKPAKTISASAIKGLVGTQGYEGYTEQELIDYYKKNGYEVK